MESKVIVLNACTRDCLKRSNFHRRKVSAVKFASSSKIVSASRDSTIGVWDWECNDTPSVILRGHVKGVNDVALNSDGTNIFSASQDGTVKVWNIFGEAFETIPQNGTVRGIAMHGCRLAVATKHLSVLELDHEYKKQRTLYTCSFRGKV